MNCIICSKLLINRQKKFCSKQCKQKATNNKHQNYSSQKTRGSKRRLSLIELSGGACTVCGYSKNPAALCFHHMHDKKFNLDLRACSNNSLDTLLKEISKCILLCHNCHMELHHPTALGH